MTEIKDVKITDLRTKVPLYEEDLKQLDEKYGLKKIISMEFPQYNLFPDDLKLALLVVQKHQPVFMFKYSERK
jgi:hypothetical protein